MARGRLNTHQRVAASVGLLTLASLLPGADSGSSTLTATRTATVLVRSHSAETGPVASGFLIARTHDAGYVITTDDVPDALAQGDDPVVDVVLASGTPLERVLTASVLSVDHERHLALLRADDADMPAPLTLDAPSVPVETTRIFACGFPFGELFAARNHQPEMTVTSGSVTSLRRDDGNRLVFIQVDCDLSLGNHGGPVVDAGGGLVGIAALRVAGSRIGVVLPTASLRPMLAPAVDRVASTVSSSGATGATITIAARLSDPLKQSSGVEFEIGPQGVGSQSGPLADGSYPPIDAHMTLVSTQLLGEALSATTHVTCDRSVNAWFFIQSRLHAGTGGGVRLGKPLRVTVPALESGTTAAGAEGAPSGSTTGSASAPRSRVDDWIGGPVRVPRSCGLPTDLAPPADLGVPLDHKLVAGPPTMSIITLMQTGSQSGTCFALGAPARLYVGFSDGSVESLDLEENRYLRQVHLPGAITQLSLTPLGLVAASPARQEVWLLDATTLAPVRRYIEGRFDAISASPGWPFLAMVLNDQVTAIFDLSSGLAVSHVAIGADGDIAPMAGPHGSGHTSLRPLISPDGRSAIAAGGTWFAYKVQGSVFTRCSRSAHLQGRCAVISGDSAYVGILQVTETNAAKGGPGAAAEILMYAIDDLSQPVLSLASSSTVLGFDVVHHRLLTESLDHIDIAGADGARQGTIALGGLLGSCRALDMSADGLHCLLRCDGGLVWVTLPVAPP